MGSNPTPSARLPCSPHARPDGRVESSHRSQGSRREGDRCAEDSGPCASWASGRGRVVRWARGGVDPQGVGESSVATFHATMSQRLVRGLPASMGALTGCSTPRSSWPTPRWPGWRPSRRSWPGWCSGGWSPFLGVLALGGLSLAWWRWGNVAVRWSGSLRARSPVRTGRRRRHPPGRDRSRCRRQAPADRPGAQQHGRRVRCPHLDLVDLRRPGQPVGRGRRAPVT